VRFLYWVADVLETAKIFDRQEFQWTGDIRYKDTKGRLQMVNVSQCRETVSGKSSRFNPIAIGFITNISEVAIPPHDKEKPPRALDRGTSSLENRE
jgi:hypothetical protein